MKRKAFIVGFVMFLIIIAIVIGLILYFELSVCKKESSTESVSKTKKEADNPKVIFDDEAFSFELLRVMSSAPCGASDISECTITAKQIKQGDFENWYSQWYKTAERIYKNAEESLAKGHKVSAMGAFLRAETYYRTSEFYLHGNPADPRIKATARKARESFQKAIALSPTPIEKVEIPYQNTKLPGYFYKVDNSKKPRPTVIIQTGFDGTQEELYASGAIAGIRRGYNVLSFEGPGQGKVIREQGIPFRADWEKVIMPVVNYALSRPEVNHKKLALWGISLGGYLAPRGAAFEHRITALIADGGMYNPGGFAMGFTSHIPSMKDITDNKKLAKAIKNNPDSVNKVAEEAMKSDTYIRWFIEHGMFAFEANSPAEFMAKILEFNMKGLAEKITTPSLIIHSENDKINAVQARELYDKMTAPKDWLLFTNEEGAGEHCQVGAYSLADEKIYNWLDETFAKIK